MARGGSVIALLLGILACGGTPVLPTAAPLPNGVMCPPETKPLTIEASAPDPRRWIPGTRLHLCVDGSDTPLGPHVETWPEGGTSAEGQWSAEGRDGTWLAWQPDGTFDQRQDLVDGVADGVHHVRSADGVVVEITVIDGVATDLHPLPQDTPMPEWVSGERTSGLRHQRP